MGNMCGVPYGKVIYAGSLAWLLAWLEGGSCRPLPSHKRERGDVGGFGGGAVPVTLEVSAYDDDMMRKRLRWICKRFANLCVFLVWLREIA